MKLLILAAGQGVRLRPLTDDKPKCMVEYKGKAIIDHILSAAGHCGLSDITIVKGYKAEALTRPHCKSFINPRFAETNMVYTMFCAEDELDSDLVVSYADIVYRPEVLQALLEARGDFCVVIDKAWRSLWEARMENPLADAETLKLDGDGNILELGKKPKAYSEIEGQYIGLLKISKEALSSVRSFYHSLDKDVLYDGKPFEQMYMTSFIQLIIDRLMPVKAVPIEGGWLEIDQLSDLGYDLEI